MACGGVCGFPLLQNHLQRAWDFVRYLALLAGSKLSLWHTLMTSGEFGFERDVIERFCVGLASAGSFRKIT